MNQIILSEEYQKNIPVKLSKSSLSILQNIIIEHPDYFNLIEIFFIEIKKKGNMIMIEETPNIIILLKTLYEIKKIDPRECGNIFKFIINIIIFKILDNNNELVDIIDNLIDSSVDFISVKKRYTCSCLCQIS